MNTLVRAPGLLALAAILSGGCIIVDDTDDDDAATTVAATSGQATSETGGAESSSTGADESGSSGAAIDCSQCDADVQPDVLCHSEYDAANDVCACEDGYVFVDSDPAGNSNFECELGEEPPVDGCGSDPNNTVDADGNCVCIEGWTFCTSDPDDYSCCEV